MADLTLPFESGGLERVRTTRRRGRLFAEGTSPGHGSEERMRGFDFVMNLTAETGPVGARRTSILLLFASNLLSPPLTRMYNRVSSHL